MAKLTATRRTAPSTPDILGQDVSPGDTVAIAVSTAYGSRAAEQRLVRIEKIYLDDSSGEPYGSSLVCFRDPTTGYLYQTAPDVYSASRKVTDWKTGLPVDGTAWVPTVVANPHALGHGYTGAYEVVYRPEARVVGFTIDRQGMRTVVGRTRNTYMTSGMIKIDEAALAAAGERA